MSSCAESGWPIRENDYDPNGNRLLDFADGVKTATTVGDNNQLTAVGDEDFMTDFFGNTTDINDGVTDQFFEYNWERNLTQAYLDESYSDTHEYDGNGRRMRSKLNSAANWTHFVHDELTEQVLCEFTLVSSTFTLKAANTYGWGLISSNRETVKRYFHFDGLGNTVALTDSSGDVQDTYAYTAFGLLLSSSGSSVNPYRYVGQWGYYDDGAMGSPHDFVLCGVRYYAPRYGRFLTWDPISANHLYEYVRSCPTRFVDPLGLTAVQGGGLDRPCTFIAMEALTDFDAGRREPPRYRILSGSKTRCVLGFKCSKVVPGWIGRTIAKCSGTFDAMLRHWCRACGIACIAACCTDAENDWGDMWCIALCAGKERQCKDDADFSF